MVIPINEVSLDSAAEKILLEVTDTVDNIDDRTHWSLNVSVWCLFPTYYWSKRSKKYRVIKEGEVISNIILSIPDRQIILIPQ